jgi:hypothetical protein
MEADDDDNEYDRRLAEDLAKHRIGNNQKEQKRCGWRKDRGGRVFSSGHPFSFIKCRKLGRCRG